MSDAPLADAPMSDAPRTDAATPDAPPSDGGPCAVCAGAMLTWGSDGGFRCTFDTSSLAACASFMHRRMAGACDPIDLGCTNEVPACESPAGDAIVVADVNAALAHPDVAVAIAAAPVLYGTDPRAFDGSVFYVEIGGARVEVGPCADASCSDVPAGLRALETVLEALTTQELLRGECATVFGAP